MQFSPFRCNFIEPNESMGFSRFDLGYWKSPESFLNLLSGLPSVNSVSHQIEARSTYPFRKNIVSILQQQYQNFDPSSTVFRQITKLEQANTFTVICAHQPCIMGGPMFWAYKILSTIHLCNLFSKQYPQYQFIPVYYSGNEDHDFEEINKLNIFQKQIIWKETSGHATGRLAVHGLPDIILELETLFARNDSATSFFTKSKIWLEKSSNYSDYFRYFVNDLFGEKGLIYFNPDDAAAKSLFSEIIKKELKDQFIYQNTKNANATIQSMNLPLQVNPRELNLFYHHKTGRKRLIKKDGIFELNETEIKWKESEILEELKINPANFSPNVLLRPLYQEFLFPNVAFVGGGGEIAYWLQLKKCFEIASIPYPLLFRRLSAFSYDQSMLSKISKTPFPPEQFLIPLHELEKSFIKLHTNSDTILETDVAAINILLEKIKMNCENLDTSSKSSIENELQKINKSLEHISSKSNKVLKQKHEQDLQNIRKIKETLFPSNSIQERLQSFLPNYFKYGNDYFDVIENNYDPSIAKVALFMENNNLKHIVT